MISDLISDFEGLDNLVFSGDFQEAINCLEMYLSETEFPVQEAFWYLGLLYWLTEQNEKAEEIWSWGVLVNNSCVSLESFLENFVVKKIDILSPDITFKLVVSLNSLRDGQGEDLIETILKFMFNHFRYQEVNILCDLLTQNYCGSDRVYFWWGNCLRKLANDDMAITKYQQAIESNPHNPDYYYNLVESYQAIGEIQLAKGISEKAIVIFSKDYLLLYQNFLLLPIIYTSQEQLHLFQQYRRESLERLINQCSTETQEDCQKMAFAIGLNSDFLSCYQEKTDLDLQKKYGQFVTKIMNKAYPSLNISNQKNCLKSIKSKIKIGYISRNLRDQTIGRYFLGWIQYHSKDSFEVYCYYPNNIIDDYTQKFIEFSDFFYELDPTLEVVAEKILQNQLDILIYLDIGMEALMTQLAGLRLAPIQCVAWGHPVTTGLPFIDYFISCEIMEPDNREEHYSEKLIALSGLGIVYEKPKLLANVSGDFVLQEISFSNDNIIYLSCQSLFKYLPRFDFIFPAIATQVKQSKFIFLEWSGHHNVNQIFQNRLANIFNEYQLNYQEHCLFLNRLSPDKYFNLLGSCNIFLDSCEWSGGNTSLDALACNLPIVTYPGQYMRGRQTYGMLKLMGINELIACNELDYIQKAIRLGLDPDWRLQIKEKMNSRFHCLVNDRRCLLELEAVFQQIGRNHKFYE